MKDANANAKAKAQQRVKNAGPPHLQQRLARHTAVLGGAGTGGGLAVADDGDGRRLGDALRRIAELGQRHFRVLRGLVRSATRTTSANTIENENQRR